MTCDATDGGPTVASALWEALCATGADVSDYDGWQHWARMRGPYEMACEVRDEVIQFVEDCDD